VKFAILAFFLLVLSLALAACGSDPNQGTQAIGNAPTASPNNPGTGTDSATMSCPAGQYDMLDWATLDPDLASGYHLEGNANPLYTVVQDGKFYWIKSASGYPWDIQLTDQNNIYLWITEQDWNDPDTFKKSNNNTNMALTSRCASGGSPGTTVKSTNTTFQIVNRCATQTVSNLGTMRNEVWGPQPMNFGGDIPDQTQTLIVKYNYDCDPNFANCHDREQYYLTQRYGLVRWDHSKLINGNYVQDKFTVYNKLVAGSPPVPEFPCGSQG
jgi:hypothetical protein